MMKPTIGFVGLGVMGKPMASLLSKAGYHPAVYDKKMAAADLISGEFEFRNFQESRQTRIYAGL